MIWRRIEATLLVNSSWRVKTDLIGKILFPSWFTEHSDLFDVVNVLESPPEIGVDGGLWAYA